MMCPCGETTVERQHEVKTLAKAREWFSGVEKTDLPILVNRDLCPSCGREKNSGLTGSGEFLEGQG